MSAISAQALKSNELTPLVKLCRMLRSMLRRYPQARLWNMKGGFGVSLDGSTSMQVSYSGHWTEADMRDLFALFATWCVADPGGLVTEGAPLVGVLQTAMLRSAQSATPQE